MKIENILARNHKYTRSVYIGGRYGINQNMGLWFVFGNEIRNLPSDYDTEYRRFIQEKISEVVNGRILI